MAITEIFNDVGAALVSYGSSSLGPQNLTNNDAPPRWVWEPTSHSYAAPQTKGKVRGAATTVAPVPPAVYPTFIDFPRSLRDRVISCPIYCWGTSYDQCEVMEEMLATQLAISLCGHNYNINSGQYTTPSWGNYGVVLKVEFSLITRLNERLSTSGTQVLVDKFELSPTPAYVSS